MDDNTNHGNAETRENVFDSARMQQIQILLGVKLVVGQGSRGGSLISSYTVKDGGA